MRKAALTVAALLFLLTACVPTGEPLERAGFALDTAVSIRVYGQTDKTVLDGCFAELERLEDLLSATKEGSDTDRVNRANGAFVTVSDETAALLALATEVAQKTDGAFDITVRPVTELWDFKSETPVLPDKQTLENAVKRVDYRKLVQNENAVSLPDGKLEPGGIAKGYIADRLREYLTAHGVSSALIDLGGNIVAVGNKEGKDFRVGVKDPADLSSLRAVIEVCDKAVVTSGIYERGFTLDGVRYHHLLDPKTGMPVQNGLACVTVVTENSALADALSTACFVLGEEKARALLIGYLHTDALFIYQNGNVTYTDGLHCDDPAAAQLSFTTQ